MRKVEDQVSALEFYAQEAIRFLGDSPYDAFVQDYKTVAATSMMVIAMAEVIHQLPDWFIEKNPSINWFEIQGMRSRLAHNYRELSIPILYEVLTVKMPELLTNLGNVKY